MRSRESRWRSKLSKETDSLWSRTIPLLGLKNVTRVETGIVFILKIRQSNVGKDIVWTDQSNGLKSVLRF